MLLNRSIRNFPALKLLKRLYRMLGFNPMEGLQNLAGLPRFVSEFRAYNRMNQRVSLTAQLRFMFPILSERKASAGTIGGAYFHQDLWAARRIFRKRPSIHVDIGSRIDGFVAHILTFMDITLIDIRSVESNLKGLTFVQDDATLLKTIANDSVESLSSLHVAEHFGLGRYGDPIDPEACFTFMDSLQRILSPGGTLYFSVPIGMERVEFNAHRVFSPSTILRAFPLLEVRSFSFVGEDGCIYEDSDPSQVPPSLYSCGLFELMKPLKRFEGSLDDFR